MSADVLREAAALMRERAKAAESRGFEKCSDPANCGADGYCGKPAFSRLSEADAEHVASWHPAVALAVANWLESESHVPEQEVGDGITLGGPSLEALSVARAYLGRTHE